MQKENVFLINIIANPIEKIKLIIPIFKQVFGG